MSGNWQTTLDEVEQSIADCLNSLEKYEAAFSRVLHVQGVPRPEPAAEPRWDAVLGEADRAVDEVERLLAEQEGVWHRWRETLAGWHGLIQQTP